MRLEQRILTLCCLLSAYSLAGTGQSSAAAPSTRGDPKQVSQATAEQEQLNQNNAIANAFEHQLLTQLGWQDVYDPSGYSIDGTLPSSCSVSTWEALGGLHAVVNLTLTGNLPDLPNCWADDGAFPALQSIVFATANLTGTLPAIWGQSPAFTALKVLNLSATHLSGTLPAAWGDSGAFPALEQLLLWGTNLIGSLPSSWGNNGSFPSLQELYIGNNNLTGTLPEQYGSPMVFQQLRVLYIQHCSITGPLPASWGAPGSFPSLTNLTLQDMPISGTLPEAWSHEASFPMLMELQLGAFAPGVCLIEGVLPESWGRALQGLVNLVVRACPITGSIPETWMTSGHAFPILQNLDLSANLLTGTLPSPLPATLQGLNLSVNSLSGSIPPSLGYKSQLIFLELTINLFCGGLPEEWGGSDYFQHLKVLQVASCQLSGTLPDTWGSNSAFPALQEMAFSWNPVHGSIPTNWGDIETFPQMTLLSLTSSNVTGEVPAFHNSELKVLWLSDCQLTSTLDAFWTSTSPLQTVTLDGNRISGYLPDSQTALSQLAFLNMSDNSFQGTVPLSWVQAGSLLSHVAYLNVGKTWQRSNSDDNWRQQLCLQKGLYDLDVTGQQLAQLPELRQRMLDVEVWPVRNDVPALEAQMPMVVPFILGLQLQLGEGDNQLASVKDICANHDATWVLLTVWLSFGGCCVLLISMYALLSRRTTAGTLMGVGQRLFGKHLWLALQTFLKAVSGLLSLAFYYYDLITSLIVLRQVWGTWPGHILMAIFFFHFAITADIVTFHVCHKLAVLWCPVVTRHVWFLVVLAGVSFVSSPLMIPGVLVLDTLALAAEILVCLKELFGFKFASLEKPSACKGDRQVARDKQLKLIDLENYDSMHNLVAAVCQSLPTVILNSVIFQLGNEPDHGLFLSTGLFVTAIIASCLAMLKVLTVILWQALSLGVSPLPHAAKLFVGKTLQGHAERSEMDVCNTSIEFLTQQYVAKGSAPLGKPDPMIESGLPSGALYIGCTVGQHVN